MLEALGVALMHFYRSRMQADNVEQRLVRIATVVDVCDRTREFLPVGADFAE